MSKYKPTEAELVEAMLVWINSRFESDYGEIILRSEKRDYAIVPIKHKKPEVNEN